MAKTTSDGSREIGGTGADETLGIAIFPKTPKLSSIGYLRILMGEGPWAIEDINQTNFHQFYDNLCIKNLWKGRLVTLCVSFA